MSKNLFILLSGPSYSGKTTFRREKLSKIKSFSFDDNVMALAGPGEPYTVAWSRYKKQARNNLCAELLSHLEKDGGDLVVDMVNLTQKARKARLDFIRRCREKWTTALISFSLPDDPVEFTKRLMSRPEQPLSLKVIQSQINSAQAVDGQEDIDLIIDSKDLKDVDDVVEFLKGAR